MTRQGESTKRMHKTKGQVEAEISNAVIQFEKEYMGRGPKETKTFILEDMILVRLKGVLTPAEQQLTKNADGVELIKKVRSSLLENARPPGVCRDRGFSVGLPPLPEAFGRAHHAG